MGCHIRLDGNVILVTGGDFTFIPGDVTSRRTASAPPR
jgi:hypothetical protein